MGRAGDRLTMRVAALYDVHGNLPALEAVLAEAQAAGVDRIVFGGDFVTGPMPAETFDRVTALGDRAAVLRGNADREAVSVARGELDAGEWPGPRDEWSIGRLAPRHLDAIDALPGTVTLDVDGLGAVLFCHATPRSDEEMFLESTPADVVEPMLADADAGVVVCGHTHMQFERRVGERRVVNAGSVGMPYEAEPGAYWALLGPDVELRHTRYDLDAAAEAIRVTGWPAAEDFIRENLLVVPTRAEAEAAFEPLVGRPRA
jgi:predicted phosphodiesterase